MGINVYQKVVKMLATIEEDEISLPELEALICVFCGSKQITIDTALKTMAVTGLIKDIGNCRFKIRKIKSIEEKL